MFAPGDTLRLPAAMREIGEEAFRDNDAVTGVLLPEGAHAIGDYAFADCDALTLAFIPDGVTQISDTAFSGCPKLTILCRAGSAAEAFAVANSLPVLLVP